MLKGERIILRAPELSDIPFFLKWFNDPDILKNLSIYYPLSRAQEEKIFAEKLIRKSGTDIMFTIEITDNGEQLPIGTCGLHKINHRDQNAEVTAVIGEKEKWNHGYATETCRLLVDYAFNQLNLIRVYTGAYAFNKGSIKALLKAGMEQEGCQKKAVFRSGEHHDVLLFAILRL